jgi:hypothetical protein
MTPSTEPRAVRAIQRLLGAISIEEVVIRRTSRCGSGGTVRGARFAAAPALGFFARHRDDRERDEELTQEEYSSLLRADAGVED